MDRQQQRRFVAASYRPGSAAGLTLVAIALATPSGCILDRSGSGSPSATQPAPAGSGSGDEAHVHSMASCGNGIREGSEQCDAGDLSGQDCSNLGYNAGQLACHANCQLDSSACLTVPTPQQGNWSYRKKLTVAHHQVPSDLERFPLLVSLTDPALFQHTTSGDKDILFADPDGAVWAHETELYDPIAQRLLVWVSAPLLSASENTVFYVYYGTSDHKANAPKAVWHNNFSAVWHMAQASDSNTTIISHHDSTGQAHDGLQAGNTRALGKIGFAQQLDGSQAIQVVSGQTLVLGQTSCTVSAWVKTAAVDAMGIFVKSSAAGHTNGNKLLGISASTNQFGVVHGGAQQLLASVLIADDNWHHVAWVQLHSATQNQATWRLYVDGQLDSSLSDVTTMPDSLDHPVSIGGRALNSPFGNYFTGLIDEVRVSRIARGSSWIRVSYENQYAPESFVDIASEQPLAQRRKR